MPLLNGSLAQILLARYGYPYLYGKGRPRATYGGPSDVEAPAVGVGEIPAEQGLINSPAGGISNDFSLPQGFLADPQRYPGVQPGVFSEAAPVLPGQPSPIAGEVPVVDRSFPAGAYGGTLPESGGLMSAFGGKYWPAILNAGLGIMSQSGWSTRPITTGEAVGKGGLVGTDTYMQLRKQYANEGLAQEQIAAMRAQREQTAQLIKEKVQASQRMAQLQQALAVARSPEEKIAVLQQMFPEEFAKAQIAQNTPYNLSPGTRRFQGGTQIAENPEEDPFFKDTGLDKNDPKNAIAYANWKKKKTEFAPPMTVQTNVIQERAFEKGIGEGRAKTALGVEESGQASYGVIASLGQAEQAYTEWKKLGGTFGDLAGTQAFLSRIAASAGLDPSTFGLPKNASAAETIKAITNKLALSNIGSKGQEGMPANNFTKADRNFVVSMEGNLGDSEEGFLTKILMKRRVEERKSQIANSWVDAEDSGMSFAKWRAQELPKIANKPLFTAQEKAEMLMRARGGGKPSGPSMQELEKEFGLKR
jgi:hypothetical protein